MIITRNLEDQYEERLYSTGDDYLDELLEKAFCEGYEYAQKEFAKYKAPITNYQRQETIKKINEASGLNLKNADQLQNQIAKDYQRSGLQREQLQKAIRTGNAKIGKAGSKGARWATKISGKGAKRMLKVI